MLYNKGGAPMYTPALNVSPVIETWLDCQFASDWIVSQKAAIVVSLPYRSSCSIEHDNNTRNNCFLDTIMLGVYGRITCTVEHVLLLVGFSTGACYAHLDWKMIYMGSMVVCMEGDAEYGYNGRMFSLLVLT